MTSATLLHWGLGLAQLFLLIAMLCSIVRMIHGPRAQDRILGLDTLYLNAMLLILVHGMRSTLNLYFEAALIIGMLGFAATVALAKFLMRGEVIE